MENNFNDIDFMMEAVKCADINACNNFSDGGPFGAVVVLNGKIVGRGRNMVLKNHDCTAHAEVMAIRDACSRLGTHDLSGCVLYTTCYPCPMCLSATMWANIKSIYYGNTKEDADSIGFRDDIFYSNISAILSGDLSNCNISFKQVGKDICFETFESFKENNGEMY